MRRTLTLTTLAVLLVSISWTDGTPSVNGHCQVPCGIYDDAARIKSMEEDATTIEKSMNQLAELAPEPTPQNINQMARWINTKEEHASNIIETVSTYFLTQKVKPVAEGETGYEEYLKSLADHHAVMRAAMVTKQTTDTANVDKLRTAIHMLSHHYMEHDHEH